MIIDKSEFVIDDRLQCQAFIQLKPLLSEHNNYCIDMYRAIWNLGDTIHDAYRLYPLRSTN